MLIKKLLLSLMLFTSLHVSCSAGPPEVKTYPHAHNLYEKTRVIDLFFTKIFGKDHPFTVLTAAVNLSCELQLITARKALMSQSFQRYGQSIYLLEQTEKLDLAAAHLLKALVDEHNPTQQIAHLSKLAHTTQTYINMHLKDLLQEAPTYQKVHTREKRSVTLMALFAGAPILKVIFCGIGGLIGAFIAWKVVESYLTRDGRQVRNAIKYHKKDIIDATNGIYAAMEDREKEANKSFGAKVKRRARVTKNWMWRVGKATAALFCCDNCIKAFRDEKYEQQDQRTFEFLRDFKPASPQTR